MDKDRLAELLNSVASGVLSPQDAAAQLAHMPYRDLGFAKLDFHRAIRQGLPEVVFCPGKSPEQIIEIMQTLSKNHALVLATRADTEIANLVCTQLPAVSYHRTARILACGKFPPADPNLPRVNVISAGTADIVVAEEAATVLEAIGIAVARTYDVGVAGIHRLLDRLEDLRANPISIVIAGMDGVLPSVAAGLLAGPVIAVPTSVGYGASFNGLAALLTMLNSCAAGLTVVNIDNGFGAAVAAFRAITLLRAKP